MGLVLYLLLRAVGILPLALRRQLAELFARLIFIFPTREKLIALAQIKWMLPKHDAHAVCKNVYKNLVLNFFEALNFKPLLDLHQALITCNDWHSVESALAEGRGIVCLTAHFGNWDLLGAWAVKRGIKLTTVGREARSSVVHEVLKRLRAQYGINTIWRSNRLGLKEIVEHIKSGAVVAALMDQDTRVKSVFAPFFGIEARTPSALVELGIKHRCPILAAFLSRQADGNYNVTVHRLSSSQDPIQVLSEYNALLETQIRACPEQWVWFHKRWRSKPNGEILRSDEYLQMIRSRCTNGPSCAA